MAAFYPLAWVTEQVAGDDWEVTNLTPPGGEPHDLELSIAQTADLDEADLVVFERGFQPAVDDAVDTIAEGEILDAAEVVDLRSLDEQHAPRTGTRPTRPRRHGDTDPHFWQDPLLMADLADAVADGARRGRRRRAATYRAQRRATLRTELEALDAEFTDGLADCERDTVVVSHDAFGYLERYGLHLEPIAGLSPDAEPTPAALAELEDLIADEGITTVFSERLASPAMAETLASDPGVETAVLDPARGTGRGRRRGRLRCSHAAEPRGPPGGQRMLNAPAPRSSRPATSPSPSAAGRCCAATTWSCARASSWR